MPLRGPSQANGKDRHMGMFSEVHTKVPSRPREVMDEIFLIDIVDDSKHNC